MLAGPERKKKVDVLPGLVGREQKWWALLQLILVNKSNTVTFFVAWLAARPLRRLVCGFARGVLDVRAFCFDRRLR
ncbi:Hypothetical protein PSEBR_m1726 [Pseudomonas brassicacearum subsp. brassicacearum NFM421]|uniref:Uncharacterized protein n=1 Tax=Pseudomonas brassicacearum (strain NFM421) TaxID=994484 RepID=F2K6Y7_PSEBN|nr:Hypothetical protein PSEBR_m1726 [Pseudomonas brassicacearum subsp. brassicacearum NFM421]